MSNTNPEAGSRGRLVLLLLLVLCLLPPLAAWLLIRYAPPGALGDASHGTLLHGVQPLPNVALTDPRGQYHAQLHGKWGILYLGTADCRQCSAVLGQMREAWLSLGSRAQRVRPILVVPATLPEARVQALLQPYAGTWLWPMLDTAWLVEWLQGGGVVLIDPRGLPVLRYDADVWYADIAKDLKRLLRTSHIG